MKLALTLVFWTLAVPVCGWIAWEAIERSRPAFAIGCAYLGGFAFACVLGSVFSIADRSPT